MEPNYHKTSLSAGETVRALLLGDPAVAAITRQIAPVVIAPETSLPYLVYRRTELATVATKSGYVAADGVMIEVLCCCGAYGQSVALAEAVRHALEKRNPRPEGCVNVRGASLSASEELYEGDAYIQSLTFKILT